MRTAFDLRNALGSFQQTMDFIVLTVTKQLPLDYFDDVLMFSQSPNKHIEHVRQELTLLRSAETTVRIKNVSFLHAPSTIWVTSSNQGDLR